MLSVLDAGDMVIRKNIQFRWVAIDINYFLKIHIIKNYEEDKKEKCIYVCLEELVLFGRKG